MSAGIEISGLVVRRGQLTVLEQLDLVIPLGKVVAVVGRAGSGKSTLLNAILGRAATPAGSVRICGIDARESTAPRRQVTWIDQCGVLESQWTVRQNVEFSLRLAGRPTPARGEVHRALRESDLPDRTFDRRAHALTPFETFATWVAIARLRRTPAILLDEPNATLGPLDAKRTAAVIRELCGHDKAVLIVTRDLSFADDASDIVYLLDEGRLSNGRVSRRHNTPRATVDEDLSFRAGTDPR